VIYLLDVNVLLALGYTAHVHHMSVVHWLAQQRDCYAPSEVKLATCPTTELGFIRVASGPARLAPSVVEARSDLERLKLRQRMLFISDRVLGKELPGWVRKPAQTTDGHLLMLAKANGARLATLDQFIPDAEFISNSVDVDRPPLNLAMHCRCSC
jgi:predicted nucleic acid-binding protein